MSISQGLRSYFQSFGKTAERDYMPDVAGATLQDSPRLSRITVWLAAALLLVALIWAWFAVLDEVTMGEGKAIPSSKVQVI
ncbi:MAG: HlyD family type I secretion periplasmic adaptor subunit, partial [Pseudomonas sp.]